MTKDTYAGEEEQSLSLHLYTYCENDGVNAVDPSGHWTYRLHGSFTYYWLKAYDKLDKNVRKAITAGALFPDREISYFHKRPHLEPYHETDTNKIKKKYLKYAVNYYKLKSDNQKNKNKKKEKKAKEVLKQAHLSGKLKIPKKSLLIKCQVFLEKNQKKFCIDFWA